MSENELKPCPFCGSEAEIKRNGNHRQSMQVGCTNCHGEIESGDVVGFTSPTGYAWNTRPVEDALRRELEHVRALLVDSNSKNYPRVEEVQLIYQLAAAQKEIEEMKRQQSDALEFSAEQLHACKAAATNSAVSVYYRRGGKFDTDAAEEVRKLRAAADAAQKVCALWDSLRCGTRLPMGIFLTGDAEALHRVVIGLNELLKAHSAIAQAKGVE